MRCVLAGFRFEYGANQWVLVGIDYRAHCVEVSGSELPDGGLALPFARVWDGGGAPPPTKNAVRSIAERVLRKAGKEAHLDEDC